VTRAGYGFRSSARALSCAAVDRDEIQRRDFPTGRKGYDPAAVDEHLRQVADELERRVQKPAPRPLSSGASEQVRAILEAAEVGAADLRAEAGREAGEHVKRVQEAAGGMLARLDQLEGELRSLLDALRKSGERLNAGLAELHEQVGVMGPEPAPAEPEPELVPEPEPEPEPAATNGDEAGARLIALNMALSGTPREETARYLADNYTLADPEGLLDDVYDRAGE
jgi:DivIVA domain-containing protein